MSGRSVRRYRCQGGLEACTHPDFLYDAHAHTRVAQKSGEKGDAQKANQRTAIGNWIEQNSGSAGAGGLCLMHQFCDVGLVHRTQEGQQEESTTTTTSGAAAVSVVVRSIATWR